MDLELSGRVVVVTGGSRGIGRATGLALAAEGARVVTCARGGEALDATMRELATAGGGPHLGLVADVTTQAGVDALAAAASATGPLWGLVNNVGGSAAQHFDAADEDDFRLVFERNFFPALRLSRALMAPMRAAGGGVIVHVSSIFGREAGGGPSYNVAKAALISLTKAMARDLAKDGVRVNSVAPGSLLFPGSSWDKRRTTDPARVADLLARELPFGRMGKPDEVASVIAFLLSPKASWVSGACVPVDGAQGRAF